MQFAELPDAAFVWHELRYLLDSADAGRELFPGTPRSKNASWREFRGYIRQAQTYFDNGAHLPGSAGALLYYYALLNLAKAELLITNASDLLGARIGHGLSYNPGTSRKMISDFVTVQKGVFPLLYQRRTGAILAPGTRLPVKRLLANCPEIAWELQRMGWPRAASPVLHSVVADPTMAWSLIAFRDDSPVETNRVSARVFLREFEEVPAPPNVLRVFNLGPSPFGYRFFQSRRPIPNVAEDGELSIPSLVSVCQVVRHCLGPLLDDSFTEESEAEYCPSLYGSRMLPMPGFLARYATMFYISSLVRYKPSHLDRSQNPLQGWLVDAFTRQAPMPLLLSCLHWITGRYYRFAYPGQR